MSAYKFIRQKIIVHQVHQVADLKIDMDESGEKDFQKTFKEYLERKGLPNLLADFPHLFVKDNSYPLIQWTDFLPECLYKYK